MKILIVEDDEANYDAICGAITDSHREFSIAFVRCACLMDFVRVIGTQKFDLIVFDIVIPRRVNEEAFDLSIEILDELSGTINSETKAVAITSLDSPDYETLVRFNEKLVPVLRRYEPEALVQVCQIVGSLAFACKIDFIILCALEKEADAYEQIGLKLGDWSVGVGSARKRYVSIGGLKGYIYLLPRAGLTNSALVSATVVEFYRPRLIVMSGICAGIKGECDFTDIVVADMSWDYQVGKFTKDGFIIEPYQEIVDLGLINTLKNWCKNSDISGRVEDFVKRETSGKHTSKIRFGPVASGSAVVADKQKALEIGNQQRKIIGIEMEIAAFYTACRYSSFRPIFFAAKSVVDFADTEKSDEAHLVASAASALFVSRAVSHLLG